MDNLNALLQGRSFPGLNARIVDEVDCDPEKFAQLASALTSANGRIQSRAAHAMEAIGRACPGLLAGYGSDLLKTLETTTVDNVRWHVLAMLPRAGLKSPQTKRSIQLATDFLDHPSRLVRVNAFQALVELTSGQPSYRPRVIALLQKQTSDPVPSVAARARRLLVALEKSEKA